MGLSTSHDAFSGSYSGFSAWRQRIAELGGYQTIQVPGWWGEGVRDATDIDYAAYPLDNYQGKWETKPEDPLLYLIVHSDCDGMLMPSACRKLAIRLEEIVEAMDPEEVCPGHYRTLKEITQRFIDGLRLAHSQRRRLRFV